MKLTLKRINKANDYTEGKLYIDGEYIADTLEDCDRGLTEDMELTDIIARKVYGETAIPVGTYQITLDVVSPKFKDRVVIVQLHLEKFMRNFKRLQIKLQ